MQKEIIAEYARLMQFVITRTYVDDGRSGLTMIDRPGFSSLLEDLASGRTGVKAVLVLDITRWGRFQNLDESAHYDFICRAFGAPVHYCSESFPNDDQVSTFVMKNLKRSMAAEYSRELSSKCFDGQRRLAHLGFRMGSAPGYGLRRMAVSADGSCSQLLRSGEYKSLRSDHVVLIPGSQQEVEAVKTIFTMASERRSTFSGIARALNDRAVPYLQGRPWQDYAVEAILRNKKYAGWNIWNRRSKRLGSPPRDTPAEDWVSVANAFTPIIDNETFSRVQSLWPKRSRWTDEEVWASAQQVKTEFVTLTSRRPSLSTLRRRLAKESYFRSRRGTNISSTGAFKYTRQRLLTIRNHIFDTLRELFPNRTTEFHLPGKSRPILRLDNGLIVSVLVCRRQLGKTGLMRWMLRPALAESNYVTLICLEAPNKYRYFLVPRVDSARNRCISLKDRVLRSGMQLNDLSQFHQGAAAFLSTGHR